MFLQLFGKIRMLFTSLPSIISVHQRSAISLPEGINSPALSNPIQNSSVQDGVKTMYDTCKYLSYQSVIIAIREGLILLTNSAATFILKFLLVATTFLYFLSYLTPLL